MGKLNIEERIEFLIDTYNVYDSNDVELLESKLNEQKYTEVRFLTRKGYQTIKVGGNDLKITKDDADTWIVSVKLKDSDNGETKSGKPITIDVNILGILGLKDYYHKKFLYDTRDFYVSDSIFTSMIESDPSNNKMNTQWMLNVFSRFAKNYDNDHAITKSIQFSTEDLAMAKSYLELFEQHKRKQKFKNLCKASPLLKRIKDVTNINQYQTLSELYDAVDPFIERNVSGLLRDMQRYVDAGEAEMPVRDRHFTLFIPLTRDANVLFNKLASWCTASPGNGMFRSYTSNKTSEKKDSKIFIIVDNGVFEGKSDNVWQFHFESSQYKDKSNGSNINVYEQVLCKSDSLFIYFKEELTRLARAQGGDIDKNKYVQIAQKFGIIDTMFEILDKDQLQITIKDMSLKKMGDVSKFQKLEYFTMINCGINEIHPSIGNLKNLTLISMYGNKLKALPKELSYCKKLSILTLTDNPLEEIPDSIGELDRSRGGELLLLAYSSTSIKKEALEKLKRLLPNVDLQEQENQ